MPLNETDKAWIRETIRQSNEVHGFAKVKRAIKEWGGFGLIGGLVVFALTQWGGYIEFRTSTNDHLNRIDVALAGISSDVANLQKSVNELQIAHSTEILHAGSGASPKAIAEAAAQLQEKKVELPRAEIVKTTLSLVQDASLNRNAAAWDAATKTLGYLSFLNLPLAPATDTDHASIPRWDMTLYATPPGWEGTARTIGESMAPDVPQLRRLDSADKNATKASGPAYLLLTGGVLKMDGFLIKRVIISNATIVYAGGPVRMESVYFVNCQFSVPQQRNTEEFAQAMLTPDAKTDFSAPSAGI